MLLAGTLLDPRFPINRNSESALDDLYKIALKSAGVWEDEDFSTDFQAVVSCLERKFETSKQSKTHFLVLLSS